MGKQLRMRSLKNMILKQMHERGPKASPCQNCRITFAIASCFSWEKCKRMMNGNRKSNKLISSIQEEKGEQEWPAQALCLCTDQYLQQTWSLETSLKKKKNHKICFNVQQYLSFSLPFVFLPSFASLLSSFPPSLLPFLFIHKVFYWH